MHMSTLATLAAITLDEWLYLAGQFFGWFFGA